MTFSREIQSPGHRMNRRWSAGEPPMRGWLPAVDVFETAQEIVLHVELPGFKKEDIEIQLSDGTLSLSGERKRQESRREEQYHRVERQYGQFTRTFQIETPIDHDRVSADYKDGVLTVTLPKRTAPTPRQIQIQVAQ